MRTAGYGPYEAAIYVELACRVVEVGPSGLGRNPLTIVGFLVFMLGFVVFALGAFASVNSPTFTPGVPPGVIGGFVIGIVGMIILAVSRIAGQSAPIPPPPPIQQPMVPAGTIGPVALNCPACGAPAQAVDRFGVATCPNCNTRFLVR